jgi:two-component system NarL family sensor kinase
VRLLTPAIDRRLDPALDRVVHLAAMSVFVAIAVIVGACLIIWGGLGFPALPISFIPGAAGTIEVGAVALVYAGIGAFLCMRLPGHLVGWSLLVIGIGVGLHIPAGLLIGQAIVGFHPVAPAVLWFAWALTATVVPLAISLIVLLVLVLPNGELPSRRWRRVARATVAGFVLLAGGTALNPSGLVWFPTLPNPLVIPLEADPLLLFARVAGVGLLLIGLVLAAFCLVTRYRRGDTETRRQLRWIVGGTVLWAASLMPLLIVGYVIDAGEAAGSLAIHVATIGTLAVPISIFIATTRYHLFGVDAIVSRTLVYVPLMGICGGIYAAGVALAQRAFVELTGNTSDVAIVLATLLMAGAITPVRRGLETGVERLMARARPGHTATTLDAAAEHRALSEQAAALTARLSDVEARLAGLPTPRDAAAIAGEPGVGRGSRLDVRLQ